MAWYFGVAIILPILLTLYFTKSITTFQKRLILAALPVLLAIYFKFGDELSSATVPYSAILENDKIIDVAPLKERRFLLKNKEISVSQNTAISRIDLDSLLVQWGVDPSGMAETENNAQRIDLLLLVSSPDFWRKNYAIHPKKGRVSNYLWIHRRYLGQLSALKELTDKDALCAALAKFAKKLEGHAYFEDEQMFKFLNENVAMDAALKDLLIVLSDDHKPFHARVTQIVSECSAQSLDEVIRSISEFEKPLTEHFNLEDQYVVPVFLGLDNAQYRQYRSYLSWKYYFMY